LNDHEPELTIVIAAFEERGNIGPLLDEIGEVFGDNVAYEVAVVDDGSTDGTYAEILKALSSNPRIRLIRHRSRFGKSAAIWTGAAVARAGWIATMDGDGQNDPKDLLRLWQFLKQHPPSERLGLVAGRRRRRNDGALKLAASRIANRIRIALLGDDTTDTACGLKLSRASSLRGLPYFDNMHRFYPALVKRAGGEVMEFEIDDRPRRHGVSKYGFFDRLAVGAFDLIGVYWLCRRASFPVVLDETQGR
jgi:glycosyltransferase involved in cell wall biosynthesis